MADKALDIYDLRKSASPDLLAKFITGMVREWLAMDGVKVKKTANYLYPHYTFEVLINDLIDPPYKIYVSADERRGRNHSVKINSGFIGGERSAVEFADYPIADQTFARPGSKIAPAIYEMTARRYRAQQRGK